MAGPPKVTTAPNNSISFISLMIAASAIVFGLYRAVSLRWISDDAFITMRYVKNFLDGNGLVYNIGERVEGYTHFLWMLLLSAAGAVGFDPVEVSQWLGIAFFAGSIALLLRISFQEQKKIDRGVWIPLAAALFVCNYDNAVWASGGLETACYTFLILCSFYLWFYTRLEERRRLLVTGLLLTLTSLTRPDGVLFAASAVLLLVSDALRRRELASATRRIAFLLLPSVALGVPYLLWKYRYYGNLLPLTYYAKSSSHSYIGQGLYYVWLYFRVYFVLGLALLAFIVALLRKGPKDARISDERGSPAIAGGAACLAYLLLFVVRSGGDFMFARFIVPVVPLLLLLVEYAWNVFRNQILRLAIATALVASVFLENELRTTVLFHRNDEGELVENWNLRGAGSTRGIADERWTYYYGYVRSADETRGAMDVYSEVGKYLEPFFRGTGATIAIPGAMNMIAYYANFATAVNEFGLTDSAIAHSSTSDSARIGHEKHATDDYLIKRNVNYELLQVVDKLPEPVTSMTVAFHIPTLKVWVLARTITYDKHLTHVLQQRFQASGNDSRFTVYEDVIPAFIREVLPSTSLVELSTGYDSLQSVYFRPYPNPTLQHIFEARIAALRQDSIARSARTN
jgi:hypothetical protein